VIKYTERLLATLAPTAKSAEPRIVGCTCDFSGGTRGMDRCGRCGGTGSRFLVVVKQDDGDQTFYFPNTKRGYEAAKAKITERHHH
jgi:hypothetical protein